jgi:putative flippase GtrA
VGPLTISPHIASFLSAFLVTFPIGFYLSRYVVFQETSVAKKVQLFRYFIVVLGCLILNYIFLKLFVEVFGWFATPSKLATTVFVVAFSYYMQKYFTFKAVEAGVD